MMPHFVSLTTSSSSSSTSTCNSFPSFEKVIGDLGKIPSSTTTKTSTPTAASAASATSAAVKPLPILNYFSLSKDDVKGLLKSIDEPAYRSDQLSNWVYVKGVTDLGDMLDLPLSCRQKLADRINFSSLTIVKEQISKDGTKKRAYALFDKKIIESVMMPYKDGRHTACISSQAGCAMACTFCATGQMGFGRNLTSAEIFEQVAKISVDLQKSNKRLSNVVFMGMGEPLLNLDSVMAACEKINKVLGIGMRNITISTVGIAPRIRKLADLNQQINLAISLHQATNEKRGKLMPVNTKYPIEELIDACKYYISKTNRRISFEWALIEGETDTLDSAKDLGKLLRGMLCHVNVIPLNPTKGFGGKASSKASVQKFVDCLNNDFGVPTTIRVRRGIDIDAGCGQLTATLLRKQKESENEKEKEKNIEEEVSKKTELSI